jgi:hypothetical protein
VLDLREEAAGLPGVALFSKGRARGLEHNEAGCGLGVVAGEERMKDLPYGVFTVYACCEKCREDWLYDRRERLGIDRPICPDCEKQAQDE